MSAINKNIRNVRNDGFSIVELIVIILVISIISIVAYPKYSSTVQSVNLRIATDKLKDDLRFIYSFAVTDHRNTWISINVSNNSYSYGIYNTSPFSDPAVMIDPATNQPAIINLDNYNGVTITSETLGDTINYNWWGTPSTNGQITLNGINTIVIAGETGYVYEL